MALSYTLRLGESQPPRLLDRRILMPPHLSGVFIEEDAAGRQRALRVLRAAAAGVAG
jgi:hypothetical protein